MMVDEIPSTLDAFIQIGREDLTFLRRLALQAGDILHANNPPTPPPPALRHPPVRISFEKVLLKINTHESRTSGQPTRCVQPG